MIVLCGTSFHADIHRIFKVYDRSAIKKHDHLSVNDDDITFEFLISHS